MFIGKSHWSQSLEIMCLNAQGRESFLSLPINTWCREESWLWVQNDGIASPAGHKLEHSETRPCSLYGHHNRINSIVRGISKLAHIMSAWKSYPHYSPVIWPHGQQWDAPSSPPVPEASEKTGPEVIRVGELALLLFCTNTFSYHTFPSNSL